MADTGKTIGLIKALASVDPEAIKSSVDDWLDDHPEATTTVEDGAITKAKLDSSLQQTVDDVGDLKSAMEDQFSGNARMWWAWIQGGWADLSENPPTTYNTSSIRIRTKITIKAKEKVTIICKSGYQYLYSIFKDGTRSEYQASTWQTADKTLSGAGEYVIYLNLAKTSNASITPSDAESGIAVLADDAVESVYAKMSENTAMINAVDDKYDSAFNSAFPGNPMFTLQWIQGGYSDLSENPPSSYNSNSTQARLKVEVNVKDHLAFTVADGFKYVYSLYVGGTRKEYKSNAWITTAKTFSYGAGTYVLYMTVAKSSGANVTPSEAKEAIFILADDAVVNMSVYIQTITEFKNLFDPGAANTTRGYYNASNTWVSSYTYGQTDYISVKQGVNYVTNVPSTPVLWFDSSKTFLSSTTGQTYDSQGYVTPPENAVYAKFVFESATVSSFYVHSNEEDSISVPLSVIPYGLYNQYAGKKAVAFGTSLTYRAKSSGGYLEYLPIMAQMTVDNQGLGNSTILEHAQHTDMMGTITGYQSYSDKDVVLLEGFVNDWYDNSDKLGSWNDEGALSSETVCGRIRYAINYILTQNPYATLIVILDPYGQAYDGDPGCASTVVKSGYTQMQYYDEIAKLTASLGIPTIKGYAISGMNELTPDYYIDIIHPSPLGAKQFADVIWAEMKNIPIKAK